jgi:hypothetical protein
VKWFLDIFVKETSSDQLLVGIFLLLMGLVIVPLVTPKLLALIIWMNGALVGQAWLLTGARVARYFFTFASVYFALLGTGHLVVYACAKGGLIDSPWLNEPGGNRP